ncbi:MAG: bifunctional aspartate transaminase/aspartate 4-decarboxylase, partial [Chloroflexota bacterium]
MTRKEEREYEVLSPFEVKDKLIKMAESHHERMMLNAGRGNPNWVAVEPRQAFAQLMRFALMESDRLKIRDGFGGSCESDGISDRFDRFIAEDKGCEGIVFLGEAFALARGELGLGADLFVHEMVDAILGDHYPTPDRILTCTEKVIHKYLEQEMCNSDPPPGKFDLFATEGGTAAMAYVFNTLSENKLLHKGDKIALGSPIFTPYLEIPRLNDYELIELEVKQSEGLGWQYPDSELEKLKDQSVKAFFLVHPSNPTSVAMHADTLSKIGELVRVHRQDLILLTDDVYGTFVNGFKSLISVAPHNTILVYSFSKYFGATGWRLGVIGIHEDNILDKKVAALPEADRKALHERYHTVELHLDSMKVIDRMVADSRTVALHHTAGLSTPQQVLMVLFSLAGLLDKKKGYPYKNAAQEIVRKRYEILYKEVGIACPKDPYSANYYTTIDIPSIARDRYGKEFAEYLINSFEPIDFVWRLAAEKSIVLLDGGGFDAPNMSVRVSLA